MRTRPSNASYRSDPTRRVLGSRPSVLLAGVAIFLLAAGLRFIDLETVPPPLNVDEALNAYEAYSILETGRDSWGTPWPITFRAFNDYRRPGTIYGAVPFIALFGLSAFGIRASTAFWGWLSVVLLYRLATDLFGRRTGRYAALLLTLSSWHLGFSRLGVEASGPMLVTVLAGLDFGWRWAGSGERGWLLASAAMFGLSLYTYTTTQAFTPLLLLALGLIFNRAFREHPRDAAIALVVVTILALPLVIAIVRSPGAWNRLNAISVLGGEGAGWAAVLRQWVGHFSPTYLFLQGDGTPIHHIQGYGQLFWIEALLVPLGLLALTTARRLDTRARLLVVAWLAVAIVPAALTREDAGSPNSMRSLCAAPAWAVLSALGITWLATTLSRWPRLSSLAVGIVVCTTLWNAATVTHEYFTTYPVTAARAFEYGIEEAMDYVIFHENDVESVVLTNWISQPHIFAVFYKQVPPAEFQATHGTYGDALSEKLGTWGAKYQTGDVEELYDRLNSAIFVARPHMLKSIEPVAVIYHPDGSQAFKVIVK